MVLYYSPARVTRLMKTIAILLSLLTFFVCMFFLTIITEPHTMKPRTPNTGTAETLEEMVQRQRICPTLNLTRLQHNHTVLLPKHRIRGYNSTVLQLCKWLLETEMRYYEPQPVKVAEYKHGFIMPGRSICNKETEMVVLVHSLHDYYEKRNAIRYTWGNAMLTDNWPPGDVKLRKSGSSDKGNIRLGFVLGMHKNTSWHDFIANENDKFHDIIQGDFMEHYHNMTLKSLLGLKWVQHHCPSAKLLIKSDDDMIINFPYLLDELSHTNMTRAIMGPYIRAAKVKRTGKWMISKEEFPFYYYPPYEAGSAYIISTDLIPDLYRTSEYVPHIFIDDVYITGIVGKIVGAQHVQHRGFAYWGDARPSACDMLKHWVVTGTGLKPDKLIELWGEMWATKVESCPKDKPS